VPLTRSTQKFPTVDARRRASPRTNAAITAMPAAADMKFSRASPVIWVRWLIVDSPPYDCQFVLVTKLTAVLNDKWGITPATPVGLNGRLPCSRSWAYSSRNDTTPNPISE
jgi:hypothetical protein